jgi:hypothetical protein
MATGHADYNGHHVTLDWNDYRGYYIAQYYWAERIVIARGSFEHCLTAVLEEYKRGALGSSASIYPRADDAEAIALCHRAEVNGVVEGDIWKRDADGRSIQEPFYTWRHECAAASARDYAHPHALTMVFDWDLMKASETREQYEAALKAKHGRVYQ